MCNLTGTTGEGQVRDHQVLPSVKKIVDSKENSSRATVLGMRAGEGKSEVVDMGVCVQQ